MRKIVEFTAAVIDVFRPRNDMLDTDWFFATFTDDKKEYRSEESDADQKSIACEKNLLQER